MARATRSVHNKIIIQTLQLLRGAQIQTSDHPRRVILTVRVFHPDLCYLREYVDFFRPSRVRSRRRDGKIRADRSEIVEDRASLLKSACRWDEIRGGTYRVAAFKNIIRNNREIRRS